MSWDFSLLCNVVGTGPTIVSTDIVVLESECSASHTQPVVYRDSVILHKPNVIFEEFGLKLLVQAYFLFSVSLAMSVYYTARDHSKFNVIQARSLAYDFGVSAYSNTKSWDFHPSTVQARSVWFSTDPKFNNASISLSGECWQGPIENAIEAEDSIYTAHFYSALYSPTAVMEFG